MYLPEDVFKKAVSRRLKRLPRLSVHTKFYSRDWLIKSIIYLWRVIRGGELINFLPLKRELGGGGTRDRGLIWEGLNREFTVIKEKHRAGQLRRQNSLRFWISGTGLWIPSHRNLDFVLQSLARFQIPWVGFRIPKPRVRIPKGKVSWIPDFTSKSFLDSGILITSLGRSIVSL